MQWAAKLRPLKPRAAAREAKPTMSQMQLDPGPRSRISLGLSLEILTKHVQPVPVQITECVGEVPMKIPMAYLLAVTA